MMIQTIMDERMAQILARMEDGKLVCADQLAGSLSLSSRTIYRYIKRLRSQGHRILSGPGAGYMLKVRP